MDWSEPFKKNVKTTVERINSLFSANDMVNSVITLDFTFFFPEQKQREEGNEWNVLIYQYAPYEYVSLLKKLYGENGNQFAKFSEKTKVVADLKNDCENNDLILDFAPTQEFVKQILDKTDFTPKAWHNDLEKERFGKASIVVSREYKNEEYSYDIQAGVYLILKEKFGCFQNDTYEAMNYNEITIDEIEENDANKKVVKEIWFILENLLFDEMFEILASKFRRIEIEKEQINIKRNQQRTLNHYLRPVFAGIGNVSGVIQSQVSRNKTEDAEITAKVLQLQAEILEHHFKLGQRLDNITEQLQVKKFNIGFDSFFEYLYIRNFFTGSHIDTSALKILNDSEYKLVREICTEPLNIFFKKKEHSFEEIVHLLFLKLSEASSFKLVFRGETSKIFFELPENLASMNVVMKFSSAFIVNFKSHWMKDVYVSSTGSALNSFLIVYSNTDEIYFFQYKENQGYKDYVINLPESSSSEDDASFIESYKQGFTEQSSKSGLGNNDLKSLLENNNIGCSTQKKDVKIEYPEDGEQKIKEVSLYFKKLTLNKNSTLIKKINYEKILFCHIGR